MKKQKCKCRNTTSPIAKIRFWNANCPIHTESEVKRNYDAPPKPKQDKPQEEIDEKKIFQKHGRIVRKAFKSVQPPQKEGWEESFKKDYGFMRYNQESVDEMSKLGMWDVVYENIKFFIKQSLASQKQQMVEVIKKLRKKRQLPLHKDVLKRRYDCDVQSFNSALVEVRKALENIKS